VIVITTACKCKVSYVCQRGIKLLLYLAVASFCSVELLLEWNVKHQKKLFSLSHIQSITPIPTSSSTLQLASPDKYTELYTDLQDDLSCKTSANFLVRFMNYCMTVQISGKTGHMRHFLYCTVVYYSIHGYVVPYQAIRR
jgi:hypothetical protein